jgi:drug/metabolite transporter (DMT)-like permease
VVSGGERRSTGSTGTSHGGVHAALLGMALMWGLSWPAGRALALAMPPLSGSAWRFSIAALLLFVWWRWLPAREPRAALRLSPRQWAGLAAGGAVGVAGYAFFFMIALRHVEASRAAVVVTTNPVFTTLLAAWLFHERFNTRVAIGLVLALVGAATVLTQGAPWTLFGGSVGLGEWLLLGCIATWVGYTLIARALLAGIDSLAATAITSAVGTALLWAAALAVEGPSQAWASLTGLTLGGWASLLFLAIGSTVLAYAWYFRGVAALGAGTAASYISLVPVFGVASSVLLLGEPVTPSLLIGGALALTGVVIANRARR